MGKTHVTFADYCIAARRSCTVLYYQQALNPSEEEITERTDIQADERLLIFGYLRTICWFACRLVSRLDSLHAASEKVLTLIPQCPNGYTMLQLYRFYWLL